MPWCPVCKNEYREGIKVCADCGADLVDTLPEEKEVHRVGLFTEEELMKRPEVLKQLMPEGVTAALQQAAQSSGSDPEDVFADAFPGEEEPSSEETPSHTVYMDSASQAEENRSSAWVLTVVGVIGIVVMILGLAGVLPIRVGNSYLFYGVMSAVFILFVVSGAVSMHNAKIFEVKAKSEKALETTLVEWVRDNVTAGDIDREIGTAESEGIRYYRRVEALTNRLNRQFVNLDPGFVEHLIDEKLYDSVFGSKEKNPEAL